MSAPQKYRTTVVVDAVQWTGSNIPEIDAFLDDGEVTSPTDGVIFIDTENGEEELKPGDWIVRVVGGDGDFEVVDAEFFASTYEAVQA